MENEKSINIKQIERLVYQQSIGEASSAIVKLLEIAELKGILQLDEKDNFLNQYTCLASAFTAFFANPKVLLSPEGFQAFIKYKKHMLGVFELSGFGGTDHLLSLVATQNEDDKFSIKGEQQLMKFLLLYSLYSEVDIDFASLLQKAPKLVLPAYISLVGEEGILTHLATERRDNLLQMGPLLENIPLDNVSILTRLSNLWMFCSYTDLKTKHDIKHHLNINIQKFLNKSGITAPPLPVPRKIKKRPVIIIPSECFTSTHAMYRCYAPSIQQLREKFELVCIAEDKSVDDNSKQLFDKVVTFDLKDTIMKKLVGKVIKLKPDMIYFPSLGMSQWALLLANLRLAPIQFMTLGHPATSRSKFIDYVLMREIIFSTKEDCFSEKVVLLDTESVMHIPPYKSIKIPPNIRKNPEVIKLAITSTALKLNANFMEVCKEILDNSTQPIEFNFFPSEHGMSYQKIQQRIHNWIPNAKVYKTVKYNDYITILNDCDIHLSPFPFGGSNSNIDSMQQGIPIVALEGNEPHSRTDAVFLTLGNLPSWLLTQSKEEYVTAALRLIHNEDERIAISEALLAQDFENIFRDHEFNNHEATFGKTIDWLYNNHEALQQDGRKIWTLEGQSNFNSNY